MIPAPLKSALDTFARVAHNPALYKAHTDALHEAVIAMDNLAYPPPRRCSHGTVQVGGWVDGIRINGRVCNECWREMYGSDYYITKEIAK